VTPVPMFVVTSVIPRPDRDLPVFASNLLSSNNLAVPAVLDKPCAKGSVLGRSPESVFWGYLSTVCAAKDSTNNRLTSRIPVR